MTRRSSERNLTTTSRPVVVLCLCISAGLWALDETAPAPEAKDAADERGFVTIGTVRFHPKDKIVEADGYLNMNRGFIEFLACAPGEKEHETLVSLAASPVDLKAALLLLGLEDAGDPKVGEGIAAIPGKRVMILLRWTGPPTREESARASAGGDATGEVKTPDQKSDQRLDAVPRVHERRIEDLLVNGYVEEAMERCGFVYTGSRFVPKSELTLPEWEVPPPESAEKPASAPAEEVIFAPLLTGEYIATGHRPLSLLNNPLELYHEDAYYYAYWERLPALQGAEPLPVTMIFRLPKEGEIDYTITRMSAPPPPAESKDAARAAGDGKE